MKVVILTEHFINRMLDYYSMSLGLPTREAITEALLTAHWKFDRAYAFAYISPKNGDFCLFVATDAEGKLVNIETFRSDVEVHEETNGYTLHSAGQAYRLESSLMATRIG